MKKNSLNANTVNKSNGLQVVDVVDNTKTKAKVNKPDVLEDTANSLEETENPKKKEIFDKVRDLFGFSKFDKESFAKSLATDLANGKISFADFQKKMSEGNKAVNNSNEELENISFDDVCTTISESDLLADVSRYIGTTDLVSLKKNLVSGDKVVLYHGSQSENGEKFEVCKVSVKGLHKPYTDICYTSLADATTSNIIKSFRHYGYYLDSLKRCKRQRKTENDLVSKIKELKEKLHTDFGYMPEDFANI